MLTHVFGAKCIGIDAVKVTVELDISRGIGIHLVGLADAAVKESLLRTVTALETLSYHVPGKKIVINLAPADLRKSGSGYDLPIALGIISASEQVALPLIERFIVLGELGLDGSVRAVAGALPVTEFALKNGFDGVILPVESALEAVEFTDTKVYGVANLNEAVRILKGEENCEDLLVWNRPEYMETRDSADLSEAYLDFSEIIGQKIAKRGIEIAAAGGHNVVMIGSPGSGKSSLAKAMAGILPPLNREEALETSKLYSISGKGSQRIGLMRTRPFRAPHYSASIAAIIGGGGGADTIIPGEVSLAQNGVLFLDEIGQMPRSVIEALRGPIEDRYVTISRLRSKACFPSSFSLVVASNPCPCGYWGEGDKCTCTPSQRINYLSKLSGPILDRIDVQLSVAAVPPREMLSGVGRPESSAAVAQRVLAARSIQEKRFAAESISTNAEMSNRHIEKYCRLSEECQRTMEKLLDKTGLSVRAYFRIIKVARTIADLVASPDIRPEHLLEAAGYRFLDKSKF